MRVSLVLLPFALWSGPLLAQPAPTQLFAVPPALVDPATAGQLADAAQSLSQVILDMKVGGVQAALEGRRPTRAERNMTVRDLARRKDPNFDRNLDEQIAAARPRIEQSVRAVNEALPVIQQSLADAQRSIERAVANLPDPNYPQR